MRYPLLLLLACLALVRGPAQAQQPPPAPQDAYTDEYKALVQDLNKAMREYQAPYYNAKTDEERSKVVLDPAKNPARAYQAKFEAFAKKAKGTRSGAQALLQITNLGPSTGDKAVGIKAYKTLISEYADYEETEQAVASLQYGMYTIGAEESRAILKSVVDGKAPDNVRAAALYALGTSMLSDRKATDAQKKQARQYLDRLTKDYSSSRYAASASGAIFELENLQIGMVAPDIEATDENGQKFKLSDYRGKVVVLDFWGWW